jgi:hypothetical protein
LFYFLLTRSGKNITKTILVTNLSLALLFIFLEAFDVFNIFGSKTLFLSRIASIFNDSSAYSRLVAPWELLQAAIRTNLFGVPLTELRVVFRIDPSIPIAGVDNALLNLFTAFGLTALIILFLILRNIWRDPLLVTYFLLAAMFNGALFSFDKVAVIGWVILLSGIKLRKLHRYDD